MSEVCTRALSPPDCLISGKSFFPDLDEDALSQLTAGITVTVHCERGGAVTMDKIDLGDEPVIIYRCQRCGMNDMTSA